MGVSRTAGGGPGGGPGGGAGRSLEQPTDRINADIDAGDQRIGMLNAARLLTMLPRKLLMGILALGLVILAAQTKKEPPVLILIGPPASGKSTQAAMLAKRYQFIVITDVELRKEGRSLDGMNKAFAARMEKVDVSKGLILDGYPETRDQADFLGKVLDTKGLRRPLVVQIDVADDVARERARKQGVDMKQFEELLAEYKRELQTAMETYPSADIWRINGEKTPQEVQQTVRSLLSERLQ